ncbi:proteasome assembly chaperone family protein [Candidatus Woesearchaeota archaeon]|nr:proteasome assembly chaperone family protein [Candidatus Woesearchaeota archaeon]
MATLIQLSKTPKNVTVIEGFPGFGLVGTITTGFLIDHLNCELIGKHYFEQGPVTLAVHGCRIIDPIGIYYNKKFNILVIHSITPAANLEWKAADLVNDVCKQCTAKEVITIEGVGSADIGEEPRAFAYCTNPTTQKQLAKLGYPCLGEGIIVGVTASLIMRHKLPITSLFAETHSNLPDSKAASKIIEVLDKYLGLNVDAKPLLKQASEFEHKLKGIMEQSHKAQELQEKKQLSYVG